MVYLKLTFTAIRHDNHAFPTDNLFTVRPLKVLPC